MDLYILNLIIIHSQLNTTTKTPKYPFCLIQSMVIPLYIVRQKHLKCFKILNVKKKTNDCIYINYLIIILAKMENTEKEKSGRL